MSSLLDQLIRDHGDDVTSQIARKMGISPEEAARVLSAAAPVILDRFQPDADGTGHPGHSESDPSLVGILSGTGQQMNDQIRGQLGVNQEKAAQVIPLLVPVVLRFLMKRLPYGSTAVPVITSLVEKQGYGSLDELAVRLAKHVTPESVPGKPAPSIPTLLGRWAGKWFPSGED